MTTDRFPTFATALRRRFEEMTHDTLYVVNYDRDKIWETYLKAFPEGSNPTFITNSEHDCSCCRHFIRNIGSVVAIQNGRMTSVWDLNVLPDPYQAVADAMSVYVKSCPIRDIFVASETSFGAATTRDLINGRTVQFSHFYVGVPRQFIFPKKELDERRGFTRTTYQVLTCSLEELKPSAVSIVLDLIQQNAIYRGQEFKNQVLEFKRIQERWLSVADPKTRETIVWSMTKGAASRFRNTVIGTLVQDISSGKDLEVAVRAFESKVAPLNYKRTTAPITKIMIEDAMKTIQELDLESALERRHARLEDVSVNSVLFVDNSVQGRMKGGLKGLLMEEAKPAPFNPKQTEEIDIDSFVEKVLPKANGIKLYLENSMLGNFVSMTAPAHEDSKSLFRWNNDFAWSYDGNVTDSIKDKVKRAGGRVENVALRVSLAWHNYDDLDLHIIEPNGNHIYYANKSGKLDVDMNAGSGQTREPVENIRWIDLPRAGDYRVYVHQFRKRESVGAGFTVEIESPSGLESLSYNKALAQGVQRPVAVLKVKGGVTVVPEDGMVGGSIGQEKWSLKTQDLVKVNSLVLSPNHWDDNNVGNKHWFFILEGCKNPEPTRGIYNEFLNPKLEKHRKVFEILGDKTKCPVADDQLSGVGFSSTRKDRVTVVATGPRLNKAYTIVFGKETTE